ncbi:hypothetical protein VP01_412g2 [Puccinia sorghi]|uniref:Uncharacterized protein n=1 Tax=Puccinia sorghi TaxID=27349 RepID=A0A0L6UR55_9BASI|nr:hypothetical protein VP01_412g2 [Puccinia sorghi]
MMNTNQLWLRASPDESLHTSGARPRIGEFHPNSGSSGGLAPSNYRLVATSPGRHEWCDHYAIGPQSQGRSIGRPLEMLLKTPLDHQSSRLLNLTRQLYCAQANLGLLICGLTQPMRLWQVSLTHTKIAKSHSMSGGLIWWICIAGTYYIYLFPYLICTHEFLIIYSLSLHVTYTWPVIRSCRYHSLYSSPFPYKIFCSELSPIILHLLVTPQYYYLPNAEVYVKLTLIVSISPFLNYLNTLGSSTFGRFWLKVVKGDGAEKEGEEPMIKLLKNIHNQSRKDLEKEFRTDIDLDSKIEATTQGSKTTRCAQKMKNKLLSYSCSGRGSGKRTHINQSLVKALCLTSHILLLINHLITHHSSSRCTSLIIIKNSLLSYWISIILIPLCDQWFFYFYLYFIPLGKQKKTFPAQTESKDSGRIKARCRSQTPSFQFHWAGIRVSEDSREFNTLILPLFPLFASRVSFCASPIARFGRGGLLLSFFWQVHSCEQLYKNFSWCGNPVFHQKNLKSFFLTQKTINIFSDSDSDIQFNPKKKTHGQQSKGPPNSPLNYYPTLWNSYLTLIWNTNLLPLILIMTSVRLKLVIFHINPHHVYPLIHFPKICVFLFPPWIIKCPSICCCIVSCLINITILNILHLILFKYSVFTKQYPYLSALIGLTIFISVSLAHHAPDPL